MNHFNIFFEDFCNLIIKQLKDIDTIGICYALFLAKGIAVQEALSVHDYDRLLAYDQSIEIAIGQIVEKQHRLLGDNLKFYHRQGYLFLPYSSMDKRIAIVEYIRDNPLSPQDIPTHYLIEGEE